MRNIVSRAGQHLKKALVPYSRGMCNRGGRNLPVGWPRHRGGWGLGLFDDFPSRMMDRQLKQMERFMNDVMSMEPRMWPKWTWAVGHGSGKGEVEHVKYNEKEYEVKLDVSSFKPEELEVKVTKDRLTISGKHEEKADEHGYVSREFTRHFAVPENVDGDTMETVLTNEGALLVRARIKGAENAEERKLNINKEEPKDKE